MCDRGIVLIVDGVGNVGASRTVRETQQLAQFFLGMSTSDCTVLPLRAGRAQRRDSSIHSGITGKL